MNILVIAPHPDDEVLGVGGTILKHSENKDNVFLIFITRGSEKDYSKEILDEKRKEVENVGKAFNAKKIFFCDFIAAELDTIPLNDINKKLKRIINECNPEIAYIPHENDLHKDHKIVFDSCMIVLRPAINNNIKKIYCYETLSETEWSNQYTNKFIPNYYSDISEFLDKKLEIFSLYKTEVREFPHPRSVEGIKHKAIQRGNEVCLKAAEAFMLMREIN